ncbi:hypothetical protein [Legionella oakridgensis]|uniref:Uncharacterized protein n=2 Tax=Legionella oakridgensis TaxID=29423 RepID=W0BBX8_9GAMM|nr:hypothetical protein [Legionella oakridgensis]AHE65924.1 hypothetical protein Loa_00335 [Legionella oakridgensis ATCC 33761 = DSM 21215]ETO94299.1 hypothetical protein LOR_8c00580 [Legionella oakridgensis RV-2-2007]KTD43777.1 hypothetical protein Loak_0327 [Legionella oakridgensis]STY15855.1 Uncharacterised protein [Legionella longbeachae]
MKLDLEQPDNKTRLELSKKIISLEIYANQLRKEINEQSRLNSFLASAGITADKTKKYDEAIKTIGLLTRALSTPEIDTKLLKDHQESLYQANAKADGFFSFKGRYHRIVDEMIESVTKEQAEAQSRKELNM